MDWSVFCCGLAITTIIGYKCKKLSAKVWV